MAIAEQKETGVLPEGVREPYDWALDQMRVGEAHAVTQGSPDVIVAVIDLGYRFHPDHEGHLWVNPPAYPGRRAWLGLCRGRRQSRI